MAAPGQRTGTSSTASTTTRGEDTAAAGGEEEEAPYVDENGKKTRTQNFNTWELITLAKCYANCTSDPRVGTGQKGPVFWGKVAEKYAQIHGATDYCIKRRFNTRSADQLQNKFKTVAKHMILFNKHYKQLYAEKPSGVPEEQYIDLVVDRFKDHEGIPFRFKECVPILHDVVKFKPFMNNDGSKDPFEVLETEDDRDRGSNATLRGGGRINMAGIMMGSSSTRPMGRNQRKQKEASASASAVAAPVVTSEATKVAEKMTDKLAKMIEDNARMDNFLMRSQVFHSLIMMGRKEEADRILSQGMIPIMRSMEPDKQQETETAGVVEQESVQHGGEPEVLEIEDNEPVDFDPEPSPEPSPPKTTGTPPSTMVSAAATNTPAAMNTPEDDEETVFTPYEEVMNKPAKNPAPTTLDESETDDNSLLKFAGITRKRKKKQYNHPPDEYDHRDTQALRAALHLHQPIDFGTQALMGEASEFTTFISPDNQVKVTNIPGNLEQR